MNGSPKRRPEAARGSLGTGYRPLDGVFDELMAADGRIRPHWTQIIETLDSLGPEDIRRRCDAASALVQENGVTYNVYGDPEGTDRPWQIDTLPLVVPAEEWRVIEAGLIQRARLLNRILADVYGQQMLIRQGRLPASLVFANPRFLRPCHGPMPPRGIFLHFLGVDLGRSPDGRWWVLGDRAQAPSGAGYALENRIVVSRVLSDLVRASQVTRLAPFFHRLRQSLRALAPHRDDPRIVLLTPGPYNETYFEHVYLARYLGFTLVEGGDLTVRDNKVFIKSLSGLQPVDVILRRLDDDFCDPLELREDSFLGVAGLVQAYRAGNVVIANALGSGAIEGQGLLGFLPGLCRHFFGEDLILPNVATWWCGQPGPRDTVLDNLERLIIRPALGAIGPMANVPGGIDAGLLSAAERDALRAQISARGHAFVGQETVTLSTAPMLSEGRLAPAPMVLRAFVAATWEGYEAMPGGLTRFSASSDTRSISMQRGDGSKDTWILSPTPVGSFSLLGDRDEPVPIRRAGSDLPSRAAENLFWLGRYAERSEGTMRLLRALLSRLSGDFGSGQARSELRSLMQVLVRENQVPARAVPTLDGGRRRRLLDPRFTEGLRNNLGRLNAAASSVRDRLSLDAWRILNRLRTSGGWERPTLGLEMGHALAQLDLSISLMSAFSGMEMENMTRGFGWTFLDMGRRLERAIHMTVLLRVLLNYRAGEHDGNLELLLELADSFMTYRSRYLDTPRLAPVVDLLLLDPSNPRAVAFQLEAMEAHVRQLPRDRTRASLAPEQRIVRELVTTLQLADMEVLAQPGPRGQRADLNALLDTLGRQLPTISDALGQAYFTHIEVVRTERPFRRTAEGAAP